MTMIPQKHCPTCTCQQQPPTYPVTCRQCGVTYGEGGEVLNHNPGGESCRIRKQRDQEQTFSIDGKSTNL